ncbi:MAG TPA: sugar ABC transporter permease [Chloroflexi bacterium]|nr:sugar ABC transporter permease [Chloroflexota bacterium]
MTSRVEGQAGAISRRRLWPGSIARFARRHGLQIGIIFVLLGIWALFLIGAPRTFLSREIYAAYMSTIPFFAIMALPLTMVVIAGEMDLSFPSIMAIGMLVFVTVFAKTGNLALAFLLCLAMGFLAGLLNGIIVVKSGIPSLVATIGTQFFWRGVVLVITGGHPASLVPAKGTILRQVLVGRLAGYVPAQMIWTIIVTIVVWVLLNRHKFGAHVYLIGDNEESARLMGVNVGRTRMMVFAIVGLAAAFAGLLASLEVNYFWVTLGEGYLMRTLAAVFLGGTSVFGGTGTILGTFIGCFIIGTIEAGIVAIGLTGFWTQLIYGLIIIISVSMHSLLSRRLAL